MITLLLGGLAATSQASPFSPRGLSPLGKTVDVRSLMLLMMNDQEDGSGFVDFEMPAFPSCPFGCQCNRKVVQCSDLGERPPRPDGRHVGCIGAIPYCPVGGMHTAYFLSFNTTQKMKR